MIQMIAAASDPSPRLTLEETLDESSWREDFERSQVKPNQSERMFFRRSLFSGVSNLSTPVAALFPSSSVALVRRAKSGLVGETLSNHLKLRFPGRVLPPFFVTLLEMVAEPLLGSGWPHIEHINQDIDVFSISFIILLGLWSNIYMQIGCVVLAANYF